MMTKEIEIGRLINFETAIDGSAVKVVVDDIAGHRLGIILSIEKVTALLMTLPRMAMSAVKRVSNDPALRITYPLREFQIERSADNMRILTIGTPDGFTSRSASPKSSLSSLVKRISGARASAPKRTNRDATYLD
jgi:hypothetical protein